MPVESLDEIKERFGQELEEIYQTPGLRKLHINFKLVVDKQQ